MEFARVLQWTLPLPLDGESGKSVLAHGVPAKVGRSV
jgi:hypothetical protein